MEYYSYINIFMLSSCKIGFSRQKKGNRTGLPN